MTIGNRIKQRRKELGLSIVEVAERLGKNRATIYRYENDDIKDLPITVLEPLAKVLDTTPADLMGWSAESNDCNSKIEEIDKKIIDLSSELNELLEKLKSGCDVVYDNELVDDFTKRSLIIQLSYLNEYLCSIARNSELSISGQNTIQNKQKSLSVFEAKQILSKHNIAAFNGGSNLTDETILLFANSAE